MSRSSQYARAARSSRISLPTRRANISTAFSCQREKNFFEGALTSLVKQGDTAAVIFANRTYKILQGELAAVGAKPGTASQELFDLARPTLEWTRLAQGMGVEATIVDTLERFADVFRAACARRGPFLIEFRIQ